MNHSTVTCGTAPRSGVSGKGREGIRKGMEGKYFSKPSPNRYLGNGPNPQRLDLVKC